MTWADSPRFNRLVASHLTSFFRGHPSPEQIAQLGSFVPSPPMLTALIDASLHSGPNPQTLLKLIETARPKEQAPLLAKYWPNFLKLQPSGEQLRDYVLAVASKSPVQLESFIRSAMREPLGPSQWAGLIEGMLPQASNAQAARLLDLLVDRFAIARPTLTERDQLRTFLRHHGQADRARALDSSSTSSFAKCVTMKTALLRR
jgi:hypothetical protein